MQYLQPKQNWREIEKWQQIRFRILELKTYYSLDQKISIAIIEILMQKRKEINQRRVPAQSGNFDKKKDASKSRLSPFWSVGRLQ